MGRIISFSTALSLSFILFAVFAAFHKTRRNQQRYRTRPTAQVDNRTAETSTSQSKVLYMWQRIQSKRDLLVAVTTLRYLTTLADAAWSASTPVPLLNRAGRREQTRRKRCNHPRILRPFTSSKMVLSSTFSTGPEDSDRDNGEDESLLLAQALQRAEQRDFDTFRDKEAPSWLHSQPGLPFKCTECGKCCLTRGNVYLSPDEVSKATQLLGLPSEMDFVRTYASHTLKGSLEGQTPWIRLKEKTIPLTEEVDDATKKGAVADKETACIFLDPTTMHCLIYEARPAQCRTYPFWSPILSSMETWNDECRRKLDDDDDDDCKSEQLLPLWNPIDGGCEGMQRLDQSLGTSSSKEEEDLVPIEEVYRQLHEYHQAEKRYPAA